MKLSLASSSDAPRHSDRHHAHLTLAYRDGVRIETPLVFPDLIEPCLAACVATFKLMTVYQRLWLDFLLIPREGHRG